MQKVSFCLGLFGLNVCQEKAFRKTSHCNSCSCVTLSYLQSHHYSQMDFHHLICISSLILTLTLSLSVIQMQTKVLPHLQAGFKPAQYPTGITSTSNSASHDLHPLSVPMQDVVCGGLTPENSYCKLFCMAASILLLSYSHNLAQGICQY